MVALPLQTLPRKLTLLAVYLHCACYAVLAAQGRDVLRVKVLLLGCCCHHLHHLHESCVTRAAQPVTAQSAEVYTCTLLMAAAG
jgi:hypothetical protein